ncbi:MAG: type II toxin-antitoxin system death-on-curing family toxin [Candidatus Woesebacteria bacterium]|nr:type II toxin-antitoxin system death-on-curing family toxin [Candidatus Woesebacteria bacterium]
MDINFLSLDEILAIHYDQINRYGGSHGVRDFNLLISAASRLQATFGGFDLYPDVFSKAAALIHSLVLNHPFVDGNKRTAMVSTARFLFINDYVVKMSKEELIDLPLKIESKKMDIESIATWFKKHSKKI